MTQKPTIVNTLSDQYSLQKILIIWIAAAAPMAFFGWIFGPLITPLIKLEPELLAFAVARITALTIGLIWLFVLSMIIVRIEEGNLKWSTIKARLWLHAPQDPNTGEKGGKLWLWFFPFAILLVILQFFLLPMIGFDEILISSLQIPERIWNFGILFTETEIAAGLKGAWWFFVLFFIMALFNTFLGEEFLFRGILLPKMEGQFGKWDWVANGVLMGAYHWHQPWGIPSAIIGSILVFSFASKRYRSTWMGILLHSIQSVIFLFLIFGVVIGLA